MNFIGIISLFLNAFLVSCLQKQQVYVVNLGRHRENKTFDEIDEMHHTYLLSVKETKEEARASLIYSYKQCINGFAALLTPNEASKLLESNNVVSVSKSRPMKYSLQTTRSWEFLGLKGINEPTMHNWSPYDIGSDMLQQAKYGKDVIVGIIDSGIWPESKSFSDEGMTSISIPESWKEGKCHSGVDFNDSHCNGKIIGAKYYHGTFDHHYGKTPSLPDNSKSPRDFNGHGTHIASIVSGRRVTNAEALGGFASGSISGGAPMSRLAIYKVCWQIINKENIHVNDCFEADILKGIDEAISDGVHVINISIGSTQEVSYEDDLIAVATLRAVEKNIVVVSSAGNGGPSWGSVTNTAPWILTAGASSIDRMFMATLILGNNMTFKGQAITPDELTDISLVYAEDGEIHDVSYELRGKCSSGSLSPELVRRKIVLCKCHTLVPKVAASEEVKRAGGVGTIIGQMEDMGVELALYAHPIPAILLTTDDSFKVFTYVRTTDDPKASIVSAQTMKSNQPSPTVASFSGKGPSIIDPHTLKPDLIAPGLNILAAWSDKSSPTQLINDHRSVKYNIASGSSVAAAHVSAVVVLLKAIHSDWSNAAIRSAIMTSATVANDKKSLIMDYKGSLAATPFAYGSGHIKPVKALDPGLVYDASYMDYLTYLCNAGLRDFANSRDPSFLCPDVKIPSYNLNYPTLSVTNVKDKIQVQRTVTNVGDPQSSYEFKAVSPRGFLVEAAPSRLDFDHVGQKKSFMINVKRINNGQAYRANSYAIGFYFWKDNSHYVRSHIMVRIE